VDDIEREAIRPEIQEFDDVDIVATARAGSSRSLHRYSAIPYDIVPRAICPR